MVFVDNTDNIRNFVVFKRHWCWSYVDVKMTDFEIFTRQAKAELDRAAMQYAATLAIGGALTVIRFFGVRDFRDHGKEILEQLAYERMEFERGEK